MKSQVNQYVKVIREISFRGDPITSEALVEALDIQDTERSGAMDIAAGWISTLRRYGFLRAVKGVKVPGPRRSLQTYELTDWGKRFKAGKPALRMVANPPQTRGKTEK